MTWTGIMAGICTSSYPSLYPIEKVGDSPYPVNAGIPCQNGDVFRQYPQKRVYLTSLNKTLLNLNITILGSLFSYFLLIIKH